jgi:outer membrane immunogenic protein
MRYNCYNLFVRFIKNKIRRDFVMKRLTIGLLALGFCSVGFANGAYVPPPEPINYFDGFYIGIGAGLSHAAADATVSTTETYPINDLGLISYPESLDADLGEINGAGNLFVGWGKTFGNNSDVYFGVELFGKYVPTSMSAQHVNQILYSGIVGYDASFDIELSNDYSFGGDLRLGYLIAPKIMIYALAGLDIGEFDCRVHRVAVSTGEPQSFNYSGKADTWLYGFMPGVGMETMLTDDVSVRAQYTYTYYGSGGSAYALSNIVDSGTSIASTLQGTAHSIQRGLFTVDLTYRFKGV